MSPRSIIPRSYGPLGLVVMAIPVLLRAQEPAYRQFTAADGLPSQVVYCAAQDPDGYMWFGTDGGACRFDGSTFKTYTTSDGLSDNEVLKILCDSRGRVWFLTLNGKLSYYKDGRIFNEKGDPALAKIHGRMGIPVGVEDVNGDLYFGSMSGEAFRLRDDQVTVFNMIDPARGNASGVNLLHSSTQGIIGIANRKFHQFAASGSSAPRP
ncbi:MAG TPA: two-component regulator propeller domain-containing protein, partial [Flavobacteriales bacterium]|nr:two-component regulator propeller domain-containing protein [Flavobacteriales bacterium]